MRRAKKVLSVPASQGPRVAPARSQHLSTDASKDVIPAEPAPQLLLSLTPLQEARVMSLPGRTALRVSIWRPSSENWRGTVLKRVPLPGCGKLGERERNGGRETVFGEVEP